MRMRASSPTSRSMCPSAGFTLVELTIIVFLAGIMMFCVAKLTSETLKSMKFLQEKSSTAEAANLACQRVAAELREAITVPSTGATVTFRKVTPTAPRLVGNSPGDALWGKAYPSGQRARITYSYSQPKVLRQVNSEPALEVSNTATGFTVEQFTPGKDGGYRVRLSVQELRRVIVFESVAICPGLQI